MIQLAMDLILADHLSRLRMNIYTLGHLQGVVKKIDDYRSKASFLNPLEVELHTVSSASLYHLF